MRHCDACDLDFSGDLEVCPLCRAALEGDPSPAVFPHNEIVRSQKIMQVIVACASAAGAAVVAALWVTGVVPANVGLLTLGAIAVNYLLMANYLRSEPGFVRGASRYLLALVAVCGLWYVFTGEQVLLSLVIPIICLCSLAFDAVLLLVWHRYFADEFAPYLLLDVLCGLIPGILAATGAASWPVLCLVSAGVAAVLAAFVLVFFRHQLTDAARRIFNA